MGTFDLHRFPSDSDPPGFRGSAKILDVLKFEKNLSNRKYFLNK